MHVAKAPCDLRIEVACPSAVCSRSSELRLAEVHRSCGEGFLDEVETTWVQVEGEMKAQELSKGRFSPNLDLDI